MNQGLLIGIDGGGTHSTAAAAWPDGRIAGIAFGDGLNFHNVGIPVVKKRLESMAKELSEKLDAPVVKVCAGLSALDLPADEETTRHFTGGFFSTEQLDLQSDAYVALMGFMQGEPGVIVICGTGSMLVALDKDGNQHVSGGWGYLLNDAGSGFTLAREGILAAIEYFEGLSSPTPLLQDAMDFFHCIEPRKLIDRIYAPDFTPDQLAAFGRVVLQRADEGDAVSLEIVQRNMKRLAAYAAKMIERHPEAWRTGLYGGVLQHSELARKLFSDFLRQLQPDASVCKLSLPPEIGALVHLFKQNNMLNESVLQNLKTTYEEIRK